MPYPKVPADIADLRRKYCFNLCFPPRPSVRNDVLLITKINSKNMFTTFFIIIDAKAVKVANLFGNGQA